MSRIDEELVRRQEYELWEAKKRCNTALYAKFVAADAVIVCSAYRCTGAEYAMAMKETDLARYTIGQYETVAASTTQIQNYYTVITKSVSPDGTRSDTYHATSTWKRRQDSWKLIYHMEALIQD